MESPQSVRQRPRPILSCLECRRKKLKCDRVQPCNQCIKIGRPDECSFSRPVEASTSGQASQNERQVSPGSSKAIDSRIVSSQRHGTQDEFHDEGSAHVSATAEPDYSNGRATKRRRIAMNGEGSARVSGFGVVEDLQDRVRKLERLLGQNQAGQNQSVLDEKPNLLTVGVGARHSIYGHNHRTTLLSPFEEAQRFLVKFPDDPAMRPYIRKIRQFQKKLSVLEREAATQAVDTEAYLPNMVAAIPAKELCDELVKSYSLTAEKTLRILHFPTFFAQYDRYWASGQKNAPFGFVPQLLVMISAATSPTAPFSTDTAKTKLPVPRTTLLDIVDKWHAGLKRKDRLTITALQTKVISILASCNLFLPNDKTWNACGALVRYAMCLGLHRDPAYFKDVSVFDGEVRRRLWATILEMDLQTSLVFSMPTAVRHDDWDTLPPANLDDSELSEGMTELPVTNPLETWTGCLLQVILARSLYQRFRIASFINCVSLESNEGERHMHGKYIEQLLRDIPHIAKAVVFQQEHGDGSSGVAHDLLGRVLLDIDIRRLLLYLYRPFAMRVSDAEIFFRARRICRDSALVILSHQDTFEPHTSDLETADTEDMWTVFETECRHDVLLAALTICWEIKMMSSSRTLDAHAVGYHNSASCPTAHYLAEDCANPMPWTKARLTRIVEDALAGLMQKVDKPGGFLKDVLGLSIVLQSVKSNASPNKKEDLMRNGAIHVAQGFLQRVASESFVSGFDVSDEQQEDTPSVKHPSTGDTGALYQSTFSSDTLETFDLNMMPDDLGMDFNFNFPTDWNMF